MQNIRFTLRMLAKNPGFSIVAILTLAIGIGANTAIFSVVNSVLLRPYPFLEPERIVAVWEANAGRDLPYMFASPPNYADWKAQNAVFEEMAAFDPISVSLRTETEAVRLQATRTTGSFFHLLGVRAMLGRTYDAGEEGTGKPGAAVISFELWRDRFNEDPGVAGASITVNDQPFTVAGVMPAGFSFPPPLDLEGGRIDRRSDIWIPYAMDMAAGQRGAHFMRVLARLKSGVTIERANADMSAIAQRLGQDLPNSNAGWDIRLVPLAEQVLGDIRPALLALLAAVGFVLLIACLNVATLLLARGAARQRELAVRMAMGAGRMQIARLVLTEALVLAVFGCAAGLILAAWSMDVLLRLAPQNIPRLNETSIDGVVIGYTILLSLLTGIVFGAIPAFQTSTARIGQALKEGGRTSAPGKQQIRLRAGLVVAEIAASVVLLVAAGLLFQSFLNLRSVDTGFERANVLTLSISLPQPEATDADRRISAYYDLERRLNGLPDVVSAGFVNEIPLVGDRQGTLVALDREALERGEGVQTNFTFVTPGYFPAIGLPVRRGRNITPQDKRGSLDVVLINEALAKRLFPQEDSIGKRIYTGFNFETAREIVGVVADERHNALRDAPAPGVYVPFYQVPWSNTQAIAVRTKTSTAATLSAIREQVNAVMPMVPLYDVRTMEQVIEEAVLQPRFSSLILSVFSVTALLLACIGTSGFISFLVAQRRHEIGIRMALGAARYDILRLVIGRGLALALMGAGIGCVLALALSRLLSGMLYGIGPADPFTFAGISLLIAGAAILACYLPARRASRVDPMLALRTE